MASRAVYATLDGLTGAPALSAGAFRRIMCGAIMAIAAALALVAWFDRDAYMVAMRLMSVEVKPYWFPDWRGVMKVMRCAQAGGDAWHGHPCGLESPMPYSPLLLRVPPSAMPFLDTVAAGAAVGIGFAAALIAMPVARVGWGQWLVASAILSPTSFFLVERGNMDGLIVVVAVVAAYAARSAVGRWFGHGLLLTAALVKFYPAVGMALALRERSWGRVTVVVATYVAVLGVFVLFFGDEIALALANVPRGRFLDAGNFGAPILPDAATFIVQQMIDPSLSSDRAAGIYRAIAALLPLVGFAAVLVLALRRVLPVAPPAHDVSRTPAARLFMIAGILIVGCFFAGINIHYRGAIAILTLPMLIDLADGAEPTIRRVALSAATIVPLLLWVPAVEMLLLAPTPSPAILRVSAWLVREVLWWTAMTHLVAVLTWFALGEVERLGVDLSRWRSLASG